MPGASHDRAAIRESAGGERAGGARPPQTRRIRPPPPQGRCRLLSTSGKSDPNTRSIDLRAGKKNAAWADALSTVPLFRDISRRHLKKVASKATLKRYAPLTPIVRAGDPGDAFYIILDGTASVRGTGKRAVKLGPGD